jgi:hypothetical protein
MALSGNVAAAEKSPFKRITGIQSCTSCETKMAWKWPNYLSSEEGPAKIKAHDWHPGKHGHGAEVASITCTECIL